MKRVHAVATISAAISEDTGRLVVELVHAGWPVGDARTAAGSWWSTMDMVRTKPGRYYFGSRSAGGWTCWAPFPSLWTLPVRGGLPRLARLSRLARVAKLLRGMATGPR